MPVPEPERRQNHIDMIDRGHGLLPIAMNCLCYRESERPSSEELCQMLVGLKETREYRESIEKVERVQNGIAELERQLHELRDENQQQRQIYQNQICHLESEIQSKSIQLKQKDELIQSHERQIQTLSLQLDEQEQVMGEKKLSVQQLPHSSTRRLILGEWRDGGWAPYKMVRGATDVDGNMVYFVSQNGHTCSYNVSSKQWGELPRCLYSSSSLAVISSLLTAIGGGDKDDPDNKLLSIVNEKWVEYFPPMPTKRSHTAAVATNRHLIVVGGKSGSNRLKTVEVMEIQTRFWSTAANLPHPYSHASATICGDHLYVLGGFKCHNRTKSLLISSLTTVLQSCRGVSSGSVWDRFTDVPVYSSTCAAVNGELVAVGGEDREHKITAAVHKYNPTTDCWEIINNMLIARCNCLVAILSTNELMVVGGYTDTTTVRLDRTDKIEIASIQ